MAENLIQHSENDRIAAEATLDAPARQQHLNTLYPHATPEQQQVLRSLAEGFDPAQGLSLETQAFRRLGSPQGRQSPADVDAAHARLAPLTLGPDHSSTPRGAVNDRIVTSGSLGPVNLPPNWWSGKKGAETDDGQGGTTTPFRSPLDAVRPHLDQIVREGHVAHTRDGLEGEREHLITHPVTVDGQRKIATVIARARADGTLEVENGMVHVHTPADFQKILENDQVCDNLFELPGTVEDYGGPAQRNALKNLVNRAQTHEEAQGLVHAFQQMKRIGYQLENVSLHYRGNQGLDMIFRTADGQLALVTSPTYAVVEAKHGKGLESLSKDSEGRVQGSPDYNLNRLGIYLKAGDGAHHDLAQHLIDLADAGELKSFAALYGSQSLHELQPVEDKKRFNPVLIPQK